MLDVRPKARAIDRAVEDRRRGQASGPQGRHDRVGLPMAAGRVIAQPHTTRAAAIPPQQIGRDAAFINEDVLAYVPQRQPVAPASAVSDDVGPPLFVGVYGFF